jgi:hypothetical protein
VASARLDDELRCWEHACKLGDNTGRPLRIKRARWEEHTRDERGYVVDVICRWIERELARTPA